MPVRISPVPALAIPGLPVGLMYTDPSGDATIVRKPFSTTYVFRSFAKSEATSIRLPFTYSMSLLIKRAISPGWGVNTAPPRSPSKPASAFKPSASITSCVRHSDPTRRTNALVSGNVVRPGPIATTVLFFVSCDID